MSNQKVIVIAIAAFFAGDFQAVVRARRFHERTIHKLQIKNEMLQIELDGMERMIYEIAEGEPVIEAIRKLATTKLFVDIIEEEF